MKRPGHPLRLPDEQRDFFVCIDALRDGEALVHLWSKLPLDVAVPMARCIVRDIERHHGAAYPRQFLTYRILRDHLDTHADYLKAHKL